MAFPVDPSKIAKDARGLFLVQEAELLSCILPLFGFDPKATEQRLISHATVFRIDPWSRCATAFHVLEELLEVNSSGLIFIKPNLSLVALEYFIGYGLISIPNEAWRSISELYSVSVFEQPIDRKPSSRNFTELMLLRIRPWIPRERGTPYLPMNLRCWRPEIGELVMAFGYPGPDEPMIENDEKSQLISRNLYGSLGKIIDIEPANGDRFRPWPMIRVDANWPGGMSGGPVFNKEGHVVGLVSTGLTGQNSATATFFSGWNVPGRIFGSIDANNPGWFHCLGAFNAAGDLICYGENKAEIEQLSRDRSLVDFGSVSVNPVSEEWVRQVTN